MTDASRARTPHDNEKPAKEKMAGIPVGLWQKCPKCRAMLYGKDLERDLRVCSHCQFHFQLSTAERIEQLVDEGSFQELDAGMLPGNPLEFPDYDTKLESSRKKAGQPEGFVYGEATIDGVPLVLGVATFAFMGGSMGSVYGEKVARALELGVARQRPVVFFCASGGARMQEGMVSLMQMAKTTAARERLKLAGQLYLSVLTHPTTGGVWASFASLGDIILSEPGALVGLTGPRVLEQNLKVKLPPGTHTAEFQLKHGMIDMIVPRRELRTTISKLLVCLGTNAEVASPAGAATAVSEQ